MRYLSILLIVPCLAAEPKVPPEHAADMAAGRELFVKSVRPMLTASCLKCHGEGKIRGGLDIATRESLLKGGDGGVVVTPRKAQTSKFYRLAAHLDEPHMPPKGHESLTKAQLTDLSRWIDLGAPYDKPLLDRPTAKPKTLIVTDEDRNFWSFRPLMRPSVPSAKVQAVNAVDRFWLAALEAKGLTPIGRTDRRTLLRRLKFDLVGLPPTPEEVETFVNDPRPDAYERLVEKYLNDPGHGERWARHWLDIVRFGESHGFEHDYDRPHAWPYRDFVVKALNDDLAYDTFIKWQIAGDEFAPGNPLALTATGFLGAGVHSTQITANTVEKERYDELDDIVRTMGTAFLGLTIGCARCHDHKYDPVPTRDYYRLVSTFTKTVRSDQDIDLDPERATFARQKHTAELKALEDERTKLENGPVRERLLKWLVTRETLSTWTVVVPNSAKSTRKTILTPQADGSLLATGENGPKDVYTFTLKAPALARALRLEAMAHPSMPRGGPGRASNGNFALSDVKVTADGKAVKLIAARATFEQKGLPVAAAIDADPVSAWAVDPQFGKDHAAVFDFDQAVPSGSTVVVTLRFNNNAGHNIGRPRLSLSSQVSPPATADDGIPADVRKALSVKGEVDEAVVLRWFRTRDAQWRTIDTKVEALRTKGPEVGKIKALICSEGLPAIRLHSQGGDFLELTHFLNRGDPNQKGEVAEPGFASVLMRAEESRWKELPPASSRTPYARRSLANWLTDAESGAGHLLARVIVNRLWYHHFGRGLVTTTSDFGLQGERPTHPELLDWLAGELIRSGWSLKHMHRLIVTSDSYCQGTATNAKNQAIDPDNKLLWRRTPRRLEAESIRDTLLAVSGGLDRTMGGPGTLKADMPRRSLYFFQKRSQMNPMMMIFDAPDGTVGIEGRTTTTIAPQALLLMNNPQVRKAARDLAGRLGGLSQSDTVKTGYGVALGRSPTSEELSDSVSFLKEGGTLVDWCQVLLGLNEFVYVD